MRARACVCVCVCVVCVFRILVSSQIWRPNLIFKSAFIYFRMLFSHILLTFCMRIFFFPQYLTGVGRNVRSVVYHVPKSYGGNPFEYMNLLIQRMGVLPSVLSISYGQNEAFMGQAELQHINDMFKLMGANGTSIFVSSGDSGAYNRPNAYSPLVPDVCAMGPAASFPGSSPYVTCKAAFCCLLPFYLLMLNMGCSGRCDTVGFLCTRCVRERGGVFN
jgi:hypothetical protein